MSIPEPFFLDEFVQLFSPKKKSLWALCHLVLSSSDEISPQNRTLTGPNSEESPSRNDLKIPALDSLIQKEKRNKKKKRLKEVQNSLGSIYVCVLCLRKPQKKQD
jgi:hypothetical protein